MDIELKERVYRAVDEFCDERITEEHIKDWCASGGVPSADYRAFYES